MTTRLQEIQNSYEHRFNCMICLCPRLQMVTGYCQHRICTQCLYNEDGIRKPCLDNCPTCQMEDSFPVMRPAIPEDTVEIQRCLGVRACPHSGCVMELWEWELEEHLKLCPNRQPSPPKQTSKKRKSVRKSEDASKTTRLTRSSTFNIGSRRSQDHRDMRRQTRRSTQYQTLYDQ
ncbi:uncharacterized protein LOC133183401 [Saccostrea echinata]|uniref:uncharacterized protein LOC133183401 n=1 Tax=Saccostrea echinata TaxID=191078 RepID=UPI002A82A40F|nr:uncharacterized protein LOC133183401 [Saccostrea echinata]